MANGLDDFLGTRTTGEEEATEAARLAAEQAETDRLAAEEATRVAAAKELPSTTEAQKGLEAALLAERQKRQAAEAELAAQRAKKDEDDPYATGIKQELQSEFSQQLLAQKLDISESFARDKYPDFEEKLEVFKALIMENPALYGQMVNQTNPAEFMYKTALNQQKLKEMGNPQEFETKLREKIKAELLAEQERDEKKRKDLPGTIATTAGTGTTTQSWTGPTPLSDLFP